MSDLAQGTVIAGYRIESLIGRGGMGVVYRAVQSGLDRVVALKVIAPALLDDEDVRRRFLAEARAAASVDHPNVIPVYDAGEHESIAYIAMRYVDGDDLRTLVRRGGPCDAAEAAEIIAQAGAALDAIHRAGFVHRDVKPANLLVDPDGHVYLTDFGLAKAVLTRTDGTQTGHWVGTLDYVAPEQIRGGRIDARADVYALGGALHYALTGRVPFERDGDEAKLWAQLSAPPPVPSSLRRGLRGEFDVAVARAMAKAPAERYPSAGDLGRAARAAALGRVPTEPERMVARGTAAPDAAPTEPGLAGETPTRTAPPPGGGASPAARWWRRALGPAPAAGGAPIAHGAHGRPAPAARPGVAAQRWRGLVRRRRTPLALGFLALVAAVVIAVLATRDDPTPPPRAATSTPTASPTATAARLPRLAETIDHIGDRPTGIALAGGDVWVTSPGQPYLTRIDAATGRERPRHPKVGKDTAAIVAYRDRVWVASGIDREVLALDDRSGKVRRRLTIPGSGPRRLAVNRDGVWVGTDSAPGQPGQLLQYDRQSGDRLRAITVPEGVGPLVATADAVWVVRRETGVLARLDAGADALVDVSTMPGRVRSIRYADGALWLVLEDEDTIAKVTTDGRGPFTASAGHAPMQALVAGGRVFVASRNDQSVLVLDAESLVPAGPPLQVGLNPVSMVADDHSIWVTILGENAVARISYR